MVEVARRSWIQRLSDNWAGAGVHAAAMPAAPGQSITFVVQLRSCRPKVAFDAHFQMWLRGGDAAGSWAARQAVETWADRLTNRFCVTQAGNAENEVNVRFATEWLGRTHGAVTVLAGTVRLVVSPEARRAAELMLDIERQHVVEQMRQRTELENIRYLREDVYSRPDVARSYWLHHHPDSLSELLDDRFERLAAKFGDVGETRFATVAKLLGDFLDNLDDGGRRYLVELLDRMFTGFGRTDLAEQLARQDPTCS